MKPIAILHLEDSDLDADLIRSWLRCEGIEATIDRASDRAQFLAAIQGPPYDLILADHSIPDFDGLTALEVVRARFPELPFLFVSGQLGEELAIETLKRGATDYVLKQRLQRLAPAVRRALAEAGERTERRKAEAALRLEETRLRQVLASITDYAVITADPERLILTWSPGAERLFGFHESEMVGQPIDLMFTPEDVAAGIPAEVHSRARLGGRGEVERWYRRRDGSRFWGSGVVVSMYDEAGGLVGFSKVVRDMTERKRIDDALRETDRRKDEFLAMLAHELRNPLAAISNAVQLARRPDLPAPRLEWTKDVIAHQVRHLSRLVDDLLDVSRITRGKISLRKDSLLLETVVHRAVDTTRAFLEERGHEFSLDLGDQPLRLEADPARLEQVIVNLLTNAAKYTERGGHIALTAETEADAIVVRVKDDGLGMSTELLSRVFDLFSQADESLDRTCGGLGIGLTIVRKLVEMHGGTITAESAGPGTGSEFIVRLPVAPELSRSAKNEVESITTAPAFSASHILVVDDNIQTALSLAGLLRISGHTVSVAHDGAMALETARRDRPNVVLLDIGLPVLDGYQVARQLRQEDGLESALIVAITGYGEESAIRRSREAGFDHHLVKPVDFEHLLGILERGESAGRGLGPVGHPG